MRRETMHVSHIGTAYMRQCLRRAGFDMRLPRLSARLALQEDIDLKSVTTMKVDRSTDQVTFTQAA